MIIHISGSPGAGKSTLGKYFKYKYRNAKVIDLDQLYDNIMRKLSNNENVREIDVKKNIKKYYQAEIKKYISKYDKLIFVGLSFPDPRVEFRGKEIRFKPFYVDIPTKYKYFIIVPQYELYRRILKRDFNNIIKNSKEYFNEVREKGKITVPIDIDDKFWRDVHKKQNYKFYDSEKVKTIVEQLVR